MTARAGRTRDTAISVALLDAAERRREVGKFDPVAIDGVCDRAATR
jgi:hypothetical protein